MVERSQERRIRRLSWAACVSAVVSGFLVFLPAPAAAATATKVSIEFDGSAATNYTLGYQQGLQPHGAKATFFVQSGSIGGSTTMSWAQLGTLAAAGQDIGGKTVNATNLTTDPNPTGQVCNDRAALLAHGLTPIAFAYPSGANNATVQGIVRSCGYGNARTAGSLSPTGATYAETLPPVNWLATRAYAPSAVTLANMQALVTGASSHGGGWVQIVIGRVCSQALDPNNYTACNNASGHIELADLNTFLDWMANAGQSGGAPGDASLNTAAAVVTSADTTSPTTTISCNGTTCADTPYAGAVSISLAATDVASGMASTHYTTDGSDPTLASSTYTSAFNVNGTTNNVTVKYRSWDNAGNAEPTKTQVILAPPDTNPPTTTIACNGSPCINVPYVESVTVSLSPTDADGSVAATYYTTDGSTPTTSSPVYSGAFPLSTPGTYTVQFFSTDVAGNVEQVQSQSIQVRPAKTAVSLTFDNGALSQYTLGYQQALKPHNAIATYFVNSGTVSVGTNIMAWSQLAALAADGNDIGGKTVNATNLITDPDPTTQVCNDRATLVQHGLNPVAFAYPGGANNATVRAIVKSCGYGSGRTAGSLSPNGATYAEPLPPVDWYGVRAYAPNGQVTLANMEALVTGAAAHHGGWSQIVIQRVCSQAVEPNNYAGCTATSGWIELDDLNSFLDWMGNAGSAGGAPAGAVLSTVRDAAISADTVAPVTTIACNGVPCSSAVYSHTVYVTLNPTDAGSAVASTHYTLDGTNPTQADPTYTRKLPITGTTTVKFRSWDNAGNAEPVSTQLVEVDQPPDSTPPTTAITCDGAACGGSYLGKVTIALSATDDADGWGVDQTYYTTDGSAPSLTSAVYTGPVTLTTSGDLDVRFFSTDLAGNAEQPGSQPIHVEPYKTVVSLTFDDQYENFWTYLRPMLRAHNINATLYTIASDSEIPYSCCMSYAQLRTMQAEGDDVGGHGRDHLDLTDPSTTHEQKVADVCNGRQDLLDHGIDDPVSYAYPFGKVNAEAEAIVQSCGYQTARQGGALALTTTTPGPIRYAEPLPLPDPYAMRAIDVDAPNSKTLADMQNFVTAASVHGGGMLTMTFHQVCHQGADDWDTCMDSWSPVEDTILEQFLDWLSNVGQPGGAPAGVSIETVRAAVNTADTTAPSSVAKCNGSVCQAAPYDAPVQLSLGASDPGGVGVRKIYYTTDGSTPTTSSSVYDAPFTVPTTTTVKFFAVDNAGNAEQPNTVVIQVDQTPPTSSITCNGTACANGWYGAAVQMALTATDSGGAGVDKIYYTTDGSTPTTASPVFQTPFAVPTTTTVKFFAVDLLGNAEQPNSVTIQVDPIPPTSAITCNGAACATSYYGASVQVALSANDTGGSGVDKIYYTTDGSTPTTSSAVYQTSFNVSTTSTVKYFATDQAGTAEAVKSQLIQIDQGAPTTTITCNGTACATGWYGASVQVSLSANDSGGAGVDKIYYTTDGSTPTTSSAVYQAAFSVSTTSTVKYFATDTAGTAEAVKSQLIQIDQGPPTTTITCNGASCSGWYRPQVQVALSASDVGGAGVDRIYYTTNGTTPTRSSPVYTQPFNVGTTTTVRFFATDLLNKAETPKSTQIQIDNVSPTTTIRCNGPACSTGWYTAAVQVTLTAADSGSGVDKIYYTTDGSTPTTSSAVYGGALTVPTTTSVKFFATDKAGNGSAVTSQVIQVDQVAPSTAVTCNAAACAGWYRTSVQVALTATDTGGSGVDRIYYTTNGKTPTRSSSVYTGPFSVSSVTTVKFFATDKAGSASPVASQLIQVDGAGPTVSLTAPVTGARFAQGTTVRITASATDVGTGTPSGIDHVTFYVDGTTVIGTVSSGTYTINWNTAGVSRTNHRLTAVATDRAGNSTTSAGVTVTIT